MRRPDYVLKFSRKKITYIVLWHALYSSLLYKMPCVHRTPMLLLPLLYECSVTTVLLSGANERRYYQRIGPSLTPLPGTIDGPTSRDVYHGPNCYTIVLTGWHNPLSSRRVRFARLHVAIQI